MHLQSSVGKALCCFHGGIQNEGTHSLLKAVKRWLFPVQSGYLFVDRITTADTNRFNLLKGKMRMGNSVLNSKRSTGLLFSFLSPATLRNSPSGELEQTVGLICLFSFLRSHSLTFTAWCPVSWKSLSHLFCSVCCCFFVLLFQVGE